MLKIATFNVNSIRQRADIVLEWIVENEPDLIALQELKCENHNFPQEAFEDAGWTCTVHGQKAWNGVAFLTREPLDSIAYGFDDPLFPDDRRILSAKIGDIRVFNTYVPNGSQVGSEKFVYKLRWLERMKALLAASLSRGEEVIWLGDINIAPTPDDVYNSQKFFGGVGHHPDEFLRLKDIVDLGLVDVFRKHTPGPGHYTYWDYFITTSLKNNFGWRIDHIYASVGLADRCTVCEIDRGPRFASKPSDHTVVYAQFE